MFAGATATAVVTGSAVSEFDEPLEHADSATTAATDNPATAMALYWGFRIIHSFVVIARRRSPNTSSPSHSESVAGRMGAT